MHKPHQNTKPSRAGTLQLSICLGQTCLWPGKPVTIPGLLTAGSISYSPDNCNPSSHLSVLVIGCEIIHAL